VHIGNKSLADRLDIIPRYLNVPIVP